MNKKKLIFVFDYCDMRLGGIQNIIYKYIKMFLARDAKIVWCIDKKTDIDKGYRDVINDQTIAIVNHDAAKKLLIEEVSMGGDTLVVMFSFYFQAYRRMSIIEHEMLQLISEHVEIRNYLIIPNYRGRNLMLEENSLTRTYDMYKAEMGKIYQKLLNNGNLLFCNPNQKKSFQQHYGLILPEGRSCCVPSTSMCVELDKSIYEQRYISNQILTVGRFDFPHKAYILGLIDVYGKLIEEIPSLELCIIGYGAGDVDVMKRIRRLPIEKQKGIVVVPGVSNEHLNEYFTKARVFVGLAGAATSAASSGLPTLIARHYCEKCEVYGSYIANSHKTISEEPGEDVIPYLRSIFALSRDEYISENHLTYEAYKCYNDTRKGDIIEDCIIGESEIIDEKEWRTIGDLIKRYRIYNRLNRVYSYAKSPIYTLSRLLKRYM